MSHPFYSYSIDGLIDDIEKGAVIIKYTLIGSVKFGIGINQKVYTATNELTIKHNDKVTQGYWVMNLITLKIKKGYRNIKINNLTFQFLLLLPRFQSSCEFTRI